MQEGELLQATGGDPLIGTTLADRYRIIRKLGEGGMGRVYEAEHVLIRRRVAIKCLHAQYANDSEIVGRFHREALAATSIGHEHIVEVTDMGRAPDGAVFMALELLDGRDLATDIERAGPLTVGRAARIMVQVCEALSAAHAKGIIHRDLKPENIFLIARGANPDFVKIVDFGISKFTDGVDLKMTGTGVMIGTPHFMSPEQIEGRRDIDHRADLYAMGVILFVMLTGALPHKAQSLPRLIYEVCTERAPSVREFREDVPPEVDAVVARLLEKDRARRFPDAASLREALEPWTTLEAPVGVVRVPQVAAPSGLRPLPEPVGSLDALGATGIQPATASAPPPREPSRAPSLDVFGATSIQQAAPALPPQGPATSPSTHMPGGVAASGRAPRMEVMMGLTALVVLLSIGVGVAINTVGKSTPTTAPPLTAPLVTAPPVTAPAPLAIAALTAPPGEPTPRSSPPRPREVHVTLRVQPEDAELWMDGSRMLTPYDGAIDVGAHDIEVRRDGYRTLMLQRVAIRNAQTIDLQLQRGRGHHRGPVFGQIATDDAGVARVELIRAPAAAAATEDGAPARSAEAPSAAPVVAQPPPREPVEPGRTSINEPF